MSPTSHGLLFQLASNNFLHTQALSNNILFDNTVISPHEFLLKSTNVFLELQKRKISPLNNFTDSQATTLRHVAISSSSVSIVFGIIAFYHLFAIDPRRRVFRHELILFLILFDFIKAVALLFYPARVVIVHKAYYNDNFCDIVGFFTAMAIEGADIAILSFAVHTALLIFKPNRTFKDTSNNRYEGGLFPYRYYVYLFSILTPITLASLAFVNGTGYEALTVWCYLPARPKWYRLVLSWVPRYCIVVTILLIYISIYIYVMKEFKAISNLHNEINNVQSNKLKFNKRFFHNLKYYFNTYFLDYEFNDYNRNISKSFEGSSSSTNINNPNTSKTLTAQTLKIQENMHEASLSSFQKKKYQIKKQMRTIFIYPISYIILWLGPFASQCIQYEWELENGPVYWLTIISAFMQAFNCTVDTSVFLYKERPWNCSVMKVEEKIRKKGGIPINNWKSNGYNGKEKWRIYLNWLPLYHLPNENTVFQNQ
ncbi:G-protein coupled receptor ASCRUDRAFT_33063, partial [Ascoidea rubescens DSM 1968]